MTTPKTAADARRATEDRADVPDVRRAGPRERNAADAAGCGVGDAPRAILVRLADGPATVKELAEPFEMSGPAVSKHLRVLERAGLIQRGREAQYRPRTLDAAPLQEVAEFAGEFRRFWDASYARLDTYLQQLKQREKSDGHLG